MENFLEAGRITATWTKSPDRLGTPSGKLSQFTTAILETDRLPQKQLLRQTTVGRTPEVTRTCKFCRNYTNTDGNLQQHFDKSHGKKDPLYQQLNRGKKADPRVQFPAARPSYATTERL